MQAVEAIRRAVVEEGYRTHPGALQEDSQASMITVLGLVGVVDIMEEEEVFHW